MEPLDKWKQNWLKMSVEKQFETAVNIIRGLPKDGPYQPSNEMMLKFYAYYKQATEGPCHVVKPSFWDVIRRAKWDAWHKLGDMSSEQAMKSYVEDLKEIIETMSFSADVADFMSTLGPFSRVWLSHHMLNAIAPSGMRRGREEQQQWHVWKQK